jgi:starch phosphorylase
MKILVNGGLNLSELDGWWAEAYSADVGWAIGDGEEHGEDAAWDSVDAEALYERLEQEVIPEFHARNKAGVPARWVARIRESMAGLTPRFAANRTVREYTEKHYLPAAAGFLSRASHQGALAQGLANWQQEVAAKWPTLRFGVESAIAKGEKQVITAETFLGAVAADAIRVELYAIGVNGGGAERHPMTLLADTTSGNGGRVYSATISSARPATDYTAQILPNRDGLCVPLEANEILWQR